MPSAMTMDRARDSQTMNRHEDEPIIDFEIDRDMIGLNPKEKGKKKQEGADKVMKANLNESSDFDLDNY